MVCNQIYSCLPLGTPSSYCPVFSLHVKKEKNIINLKCIIGSNSKKSHKNNLSASLWPVRCIHIGDFLTSYFKKYGKDTK